MADDNDRSRQRDEAQGINAGWAALGYLLTGMAVWGFAGWLVDRWLGTDGLGIGIGVVIGVAAGCYLTVKRLGA
jgi:ATP synthase protein I